MNKLIVAGWCIVLFVSCSTRVKPQDDPAEIVTEEGLRESVKVLSSDSFMGRKPLTEGEDRTVAYLAKAYEEIGLEPAYGNSYFQEVPMVSFEYQVAPFVEVRARGNVLRLESMKDFIANTSRIKEQVRLDNSEYVFAGYGIVAPEYGWDDYKDIDVKGKTVLVLVNDPGFATQDATLFKGNAMTYYGRWTYKFEEAARQGAAGVLIIHDTKAAGYPFAVLQNTGRAGFCAQRDNLNEDKVVVDGWITEKAAKKIVQVSGFDYDKLKVAASKRGFSSLPLGSTWDVVINNRLKFSKSKNVVGLIKAREATDENIVYTAHWDHFGVGAPVNGDSIYNGAMDNGLALAAMLETAKAFVASESPKRNVVFVAVTGEETGMVGSMYYVENPLFPTYKTVANLNYELLLPFGRMKDVTITGYGQSDLDQYVMAHAKRQGRYISEEPFPEQGMYFRSDHFSFAKSGVPSLFIKGWQDHRKHGKEWAKNKIGEYWETRYHKTADNYEDTFDLSGCVEDAKLFYYIGYQIANERSFPSWSESSEFKSIRETDMKRS